jgi:hypothetical protein
MDVPFEERNISSDREARHMFQEKGYDLLPVIEIGEEVITDYTGESQLIEVLAKEGYL